MTEKKRPRPPKHWSRTSPEGPWDYVVVGSGMGGMTTAAMLARMGRRVLVLEQHYVPGGFTHAFTRKGYRWDVGVHVVGDVTEHTLTGKLLAYLSRGELEWSSVGPVYEQFHFPDGLRIEFPADPEKFRANLLEAFPGEEKAIDAYLALSREASHRIRAYHLARALPGWLAPAVHYFAGRKAEPFLHQTTAEVLERLTADERLRAVLTSQWGYYGAPPSRSPFVLQALILRHFLHGGYYPKGGAPSIARGLLKTVADAGGWTRILADVEEILVERGRAVGVRLVGGEEIRARRVVSAVGVVATVERLLGERYRTTEWAAALRKLRPGPAHVCLYLGFRGDIREAGASGANKWFYNCWDAGDGFWEIDGELGDAPVLYCSFPSLKDPCHDPGPELRHTGEVVTFVPWEAFAKWRGKKWRKRGEDYEALKGRLQKKMLGQYLERLPGLRGMVDYTEVSTPLSTDHFSRPMAGSIYGSEGTKDRFMSRWTRPRSPIPGLYFSGNEVAAMGVMGAMLGGMLAAFAAEPVGTARLLRRV